MQQVVKAVDELMSLAITIFVNGRWQRPLSCFIGKQGI